MTKFPFPSRSLRTSIGLAVCLCVALANGIVRSVAAAPLPVVTAVASDPLASEPGSDIGSFRISRTRSTSKSLTVYYKFSGTAVAGIDYRAPTGSVVIPAGAASALVSVSVLDDLAVEGMETVTINLSGSSSYAIGSPASATVSVEDNDQGLPPAAPSNLGAAAVSGTRIDLSWLDNAGDEGGFKIEQSCAGGAFAEVAVVGANVTTYAATGLLPATNYSYRVRAFNAAGDSPYTEAASATTEPAGTAAALYVSTRGSDANDGASPDTALRNISTAAARALPGTTVLIEGGTYFEQLVTKAGGLAGQEIVFKSFNGTAVIDGSALPWAAGGDQNQGLVELRHPFVRLVGLRIVNSKNTGVLLDADYLTVEGCEVGEARRHGISTHTSRQTNYPGLAGTMIRDVVLRGNVVWRAALSGNAQAVSLIADGFLVSGNTVRDNATEGIDIWLGAKHGEVTGNTVYGNSAPGIYVDGASYVRIYGNKVFNNSKGIGVSSENPNYATHNVWVYDNVIHDNNGAGCFLWDDAAAPGHKGSQNVLIAHNTLVGNSPSVYLSGENNSAEIMNNLGFTTGASVYSSAANSSFNTHDNVWLTSLAGFVDAPNKNFRLTGSSAALDKGGPIPFFYDDLGNAFTVTTDFDGLARIAGSAPDAGAFEYR